MPAPKMMSDETKKKLGISPNAQGTYLELGTGDDPEPTTAGWTDTQIRRATEEQLERMIASQQRVVETLEDNVRNEKKRLLDYQMISARKRQLG